MANYLPVLLVSVTAGMPDDAAVQPLPRGQVDYLSHDWAEEDVWRSWRSMTKQKNEIANGVRLENASWRTWMKQRNKLKTVSPETLNWLKDSDVTWLYGPLHTAVDWSPPPKSVISPPMKQQSKDDASASSPKSGGNSSLSTPSSTIHLDHLNQQSGQYSLHDTSVKKPILKHRSIAEMLTSALPPAPVWAEESSEFAEYQHARHHDSKDNSEALAKEEPHAPPFGGRGGRPPLLHTRSDTHILPRLGRGGAPKSQVSPSRIAPGSTDREVDAAPQAHFSALSANQRTGASNNLAEMIYQARSSPGIPDTASPLKSPVSLETTEDSGASSHEAAGTGESGTGSSAHPIPPQKKHISFNAIVEQCIAIDGGSTPMTPSTRGQSWSSYDDDGYAEDTEDGLYEDVSMGMEADSPSEDDLAADDEEVIEMRPPSRRLSSSSLQDYRSVLETHQQPSVRHPLPSSHYPDRPHFRRSPTGSNKHGRSRNNTSASSGSGSGRTSESGRSRSSVALDREHVTIAPIAPTILKTGGAEDNEDGVLYMGGSPYSGFSAAPGIVHSSGGHQGHRGMGGTMSAGSSGYGYGYGGYGYGERVSVGRNDAFEHYERGTEGGELVYQSPNGNIYPWGEGDAVRFRMQTEYGEPVSSPEHEPNLQQRTHSHHNSNGSQPHSSHASSHSAGTLESEPSSERLSNETDEYFGRDARVTLMHVGKDQPGFQSSLRHIQDERQREGRVRIAVSHANDHHSESSDNDDSQSSQTYLPRERTPSPDFQPKVNPRIASLRNESGCRSPSPTSASSHGSDVGTLVPSSPSLAIPTPGISPAHQEEYMRTRSPPDSPVIRSGLLSPEISPRGRSACVSPVSGSATSSSIVRSGSRSGSESRSESRGRSRTRNSSAASSPDQGEPERGRSRSRSNTSGANSPLSDSSSPQSRYPLAIGGIGIGLGIGAGLGVPHSGREIRDGRGARLYRKTSEDFIGKPTQPEGRGGPSTRGRNREGKRISESLSPPFVGSGMIERNTTVPSSGVYRSAPVSNLRSQATRMLERESSTDSYSRSPPDKESSPSGASLSKSSEALPEDTLPPQAERSTDSPPSNCPASVSSSTSGTMSNGRILPPSIPEVDEQHTQISPATQRSMSNSSNSPKTVPPPDSSIATPAPESRSTSCGADDSPNKRITNRTAEIMSSARTLFGNIWNGS